MATVSTDSTYTFTVTGNRSLTAVFEKIVSVYTIAATIDPPEAGTVTGAGQYREGATVTLKAVPGEGFRFSGWQENGQMVGEKAAYTFTVTGDRALVGIFKKTSRLPPGYTEVEYIYANGRCGLFGEMGEDFPKSFHNVKFYCKFQLDIVNALSASSFGYHRTGANSNYYGYNLISLQNTASKLTAAYFGFYTTNGTTSSNAISSNVDGSLVYELTLAPADEVFEIRTGSIEASTIPMKTFDSAAITSTTGTADTGILGSVTYAYNSSSKKYSPTHYSAKAGKYFSIKIWDSSDSLIHDFIPCINPDDLVGMYDAITGKFFSSYWSAAPFTAGPAV